MLLSAPGCSWPLGFPGRCWLLLGARSCSWALWEAPGCSCMLPGARGIPGCSWLFFWDLCGRSWLLLGVPSWTLLGWYWALLDAPVTGSWCSQALLSAAERSWVLLVFPGRSWLLLGALDAPGRSGRSWVLLGAGLASGLQGLTVLDSGVGLDGGLMAFSGWIRVPGASRFGSCWGGFLITWASLLGCNILR